MAKEDCFAFDSKKRECKALTDLFCNKEECHFYRTNREQVEHEQDVLKKKYERERKLHSGNTFFENGIWRK